MRENLYLQLIAVFAPLSLLSLGGGQSIVADINQQAVSIHGWVTQSEFVDLFAISRAAPGPGSLLTTLIGWKVSGWVGAVVASVALFAPSSVLAYGATVAWTRHHQHPWHRVAERGLAPVATGLILASAFSVLRFVLGHVDDPGPCGHCTGIVRCSTEDESACRAPCSRDRKRRFGRGLVNRR